MSKQGCIYILTNPSFPDYVKIGYASNIERRLKELNRSECIPYAFRVYAKYDVDQNLSDKKVHNLIDQLNPSLRAVEEFDGKPRVREFYEMTAEEAYNLLENIAAISGTQDKLHKCDPTGHEIKDEAIAGEVRTERKERRSPFSFTKCHMEPGTEIVYHNNNDIKATVNDDRTIVFNGTITSLSASAQMLENSNHPIQGTLYWYYNGKSLSQLREDLEAIGEYK